MNLRAHISSLLVAGVMLAIPVGASAELYKYRKPGGEVLITTEKRNDLELIEIIDGGQPKKQASKSKTKKPRKRSETPSSHQMKPYQRPSNLPREEAFDDIIREASEAYDVPFGFVKAVILTESNFNPNALSHAGAMGLMQLMPRTAASLNVTDAFDPRQNIFGGTKFLRILIDRYHGDINLILAAYNAGDAAVARYDGIPYPQTRGYVAKVYKWYRKFSSSDDGQIGAPKDQNND